MIDDYAVGTRWPTWIRSVEPGRLASYVRTGVLPLLLPVERRMPSPSEPDRAARIEQLYDVFAALRIRYADEPFGSGRGRQVVRTPDEVVLRPRHGNCLDLALTFAGGCLDAGLHPIVVVLDPRVPGGPSHAIVVVWLRGDWAGEPDPAGCPPGGPVIVDASVHWPGMGLSEALDDPDEHGVRRPSAGEFLPVDVALAAVHGDTEPASFADAVASGGRMLSGPDWTCGVGVDVGRAFDESAAFGLPRWPTGELLEPPYQPLDEAHRRLEASGALLQLVRARTKTFGFQARVELDALLSWCRKAGAATDGGSADVGSVTLTAVHGVGGAGKTRLAAELAATAETLGWYAGFLDRRVFTGTSAADDLAWLGRVVSPVLVVVDYAEEIGYQHLSLLLRHLGDKPGGPAFVVLLARTLGDRHGGWWAELAAEVGDHRPLPHIREPLPLGAVIPERGRLYRSAYRHYVRTLGGDAAARALPDQPPPLPLHPRWTTLDVVMLALLAALERPRGQSEDAPLPSTPAQLYDTVLGREVRAWKHAAKTESVALTEDGLRLSGAAVTLLAPPASRVRGLLRALDPIGGDARDWTARILQWALPAEKGAAADSHAPLAVRPDPVGDHLLAQVFRTVDGIELFDRCLAQVPAADATPGDADPDDLDLQAGPPMTSAGQVCATISRAYHADQELMRRLAYRFVKRRPDHWRAAYELARSVGEPFAFAIEQAVEADPPPLPLAELAAEIPPGHTRLRRVALRAASRTRPPLNRDDDEQTLFWALEASEKWAFRQAEAGESADALQVAEEVLAIRRGMAATDADYRPLLARSLSNLARIFADNDDEARALAMAEEGVAIQRAAIESGESDAVAGLAMQLRNLALARAEAGQVDEALAAAEEAVAAYRPLIGADRAAHFSDLLGALSVLSARQAAAGQHAEALASAEEATTGYRELAAEQPGHYADDLASALRSLSTRRTRSGLHREAIEAAGEAATILRGLAADDPATFGSGLADALIDLAAVQGENGRVAAALDPAVEAIETLRALAAEEPRHRAHLGLALVNLANALSAAARRVEALEAAEEAVEVLQELASSDTDRPDPGLATALLLLARRQAEGGNRAEAVTTAERAVGVIRELAGSDTAYLRRLAEALDVWSDALAEMGEHRRATAAAEESVAMLRSHYADDPDELAPQLAGVLLTLAHRREEAGERGEGVELAAEAVELRRSLFDDDTLAHRGSLARALLTYSYLLSEAGRRADAVDAASEAVQLLDFHIINGAVPNVVVVEHAHALHHLAIRQSEADLTADALPNAEHAAAHFRELADAYPGSFDRELASSLNTLAFVQAEAASGSEALATAEEVAARFEALAERDPAYRVEAAGSLHNLARRQQELGRETESLGTAQRAVALWRDLVAETSDESAAAQRGLATTLGTLGLLLSAAGEHEEAQAAAHDAVAACRRLFVSADGSSPELALTLAGLGRVLLAAGRPAEALSPATEALTRNQEQAAADPQAYIAALCRSADQVADLRLILGESLDRALEPFTAAPDVLPAGPRALLVLARMEWRAANSQDGVARDLRLAVQTAAAETDPHWLQRVRQAIRAGVERLRDDGVSGVEDAMPAWATKPWPDELAAVADAWRAADEWSQREELLRMSVPLLLSDEGRQGAAMLATLFPATDAIGELRDVTVQIARDGLETTLVGRRADALHHRVVADWFATPSWSQSYRFVQLHRELITEPRTATVLASMDGAYARQHLAIVRLIEVLPDEDVFDAVVDRDVAVALAFDAVELADVERLTELMFAAPLPEDSFFGPYFRGVADALNEDDDAARLRIAEASAVARNAEREAGAMRLRLLAERRPARADVWRELLGLLTFE